VVQYSGVYHITVSSCSGVYCALQYIGEHCNAVKYYAKRWNVVQYSALQCKEWSICEDSVGYGMVG
jgi:hypothetical protein